MAAFLVQLHLKCGRPHPDLFAKALKSGSVLLLRRKDTGDTQMRSDVWPDHTLTCLLSRWSHLQTRSKSSLRVAMVMTEGNYNPATTLVWNHLASWAWLESQVPCKSVSFGLAQTTLEIRVSSWKVQPLLRPWQICRLVHYTSDLSIGFQVLGTTLLRRSLWKEVFHRFLWPNYNTSY